MSPEIRSPPPAHLDSALLPPFSCETDAFLPFVYLELRVEVRLAARAPFGIEASAGHVRKVRKVP